MKRRNLFWIFMIVFAFFIILNFGIHVYRTDAFNKQLHTIGDDEDITFNFESQNGHDVSWTRTVTILGQSIDMNACQFNGIFTNSSEIEISNWGLRMDITGDCFVNAAWCGKVEIHQFINGKEGIQTLDLRDIKKEQITLTFYEDGDIFLFPLSKGDYLIYYPEKTAKEVPIPASVEGFETEITVGFIFYWAQNMTFSMPDISVNYQLEKSYFQGKEAIICIITSLLWIIILVAGLSVFITIKVLKEKEQHKETLKNNEWLNTEVQKRTSQIITMQQKVVLGLADMIENRDNNTGGHVKRTSDVIQILVNEIMNQKLFDMDEVEAVDIVRSAPMHDLGKVTVDNSILSKPGRLTEEEFAQMKTHAAKSGDIVKNVLDGVEEEHFVKIAYNLARHHHERYDGKGYPDGLAGDNIPLEARIMAVADVYDALVSKRCYKEAMSFEQANKIMHENMGTQFDPKLETIFESSREKLEEYYKINN